MPRAPVARCRIGHNAGARPIQRIDAGIIDAWFERPLVQLGPQSENWNRTPAGESTCGPACLNLGLWAILIPIQGGLNVTRGFHLALIFTTAAACLLAQGGESTEILGIVEDSTGAVVPG